MTKGAEPAGSWRPQGNTAWRSNSLRNPLRRWRRWCWDTWPTRRMSGQSQKSVRHGRSSEASGEYRGTSHCAPSGSFGPRRPLPGRPGFRSSVLHGRSCQCLVGRRRGCGSHATGRCRCRSNCNCWMGDPSIYRLELAKFCSNADEV